MKRASIAILAISLAAAAHAQAFSVGNTEEEATQSGLGTVVDQSWNGGFTVPNANTGTVAGSLSYYGTYLNPRTDEMALTLDGYFLPITTLAQPVEVTSIGITVTGGALINSGGLAGGTSPASVDSFVAAIYEVLPDDELISTGETAAYGTFAQNGQGALQIPNGGSTLYSTYILRPRTNYAFFLAVNCSMDFTGTANVPSMGVTQEFNVGSPPPIESDFTFQTLPEPPQYLGLGIGIVGLVALRRRRKS